MDLDHVRQLTRSRHEAQIGERHGDVEASGDDLPLRQGAEKSYRTLPN